VRATNLASPRLVNFVAGAENDMPQMVRHRMPKFFVVTITTQRPKIFVRVTGVAMDGVVIIPTHHATASLSSM
jgi:hypothetical protein